MEHGEDILSIGGTGNPTLEQISAEDAHWLENIDVEGSGWNIEPASKTSEDDRKVKKVQRSKSPDSIANRTCLSTELSSLEDLTKEPLKRDNYMADEEDNGESESQESDENDSLTESHTTSAPSLGEKTAELPYEISKPKSLTSEPPHTKNEDKYQAGEEPSESIENNAINEHQGGPAWNNQKPNVPSRLAFDIYEPVADSDDDSQSVESEKHVSEPNTPKWDSGPSEPDSDSDKENVEEENPRLSRREAWQQDLQKPETHTREYREYWEEPNLFYVDQHASRFETIGAVTNDLIAVPLVTKGRRRNGATAVLKDLSLADDSEELNISTHSPGRSSQEKSPTSEWSGFRSADVEGTRRFPKSRNAQGYPSTGRIQINSYLETAGGIDITKADDLQAPSSLFANTVKGIGRDKIQDSRPAPQTPSGRESLPLEGGILIAFVDNCIANKKGLLAVKKDKRKRALAQSKEIERVLEKVLTNGKTPRICGERKSLGDMIDQSAWRAD